MSEPEHRIFIDDHAAEIVAKNSHSKIALLNGHVVILSGKFDDAGDWFNCCPLNPALGGIYILPTRCLHKIIGLEAQRG